MILGFKKKFPWGKPTYFKEKILAGVGRGPIVSMPKIHTIRKGGRWDVGDTIHMAYGVRTKGYEQFNRMLPDLTKVKSVQKIEMDWSKTSTSMANGPLLRIKIDGKVFMNHLVLSRNDGFDSYDDFRRWFNKDFKGQIIHWTDFRYE